MRRIQSFIQNKNVFLPSNQIWVYILIAILAVTTLLPLFDVGFTTHDDTLKDLWVHGKFWEQALSIAKSQGRFTHFTSTWMKQFPYFFGVDSWFYKVTVFGMFGVACLVFGYLIKFFFRSTSAGMLGVLFVFAFIQNSWDHNLLTSYPFYYSLRFALLMISLVMFYKGMEQESMKRIILFACLWFFVINEGFLQFTPLFVFLALADAIKKRRIFWPGVAAFFLPVVIFLVLYVAFRYHFPSHYKGNILSSINLVNILKTNYQLSVSGMPGYYFFVAKSGATLFYEGFPLYTLKNLIEHMRWVWIIRSFIVLVVSSYLLFTAEIKSRRLLAALLIVSLITVFIPNVFVSLTEKYQEWVANGTRAYIYTYFSFFAMCSFFISLIFFIKTYISKPLLKTLYSLSIGLLCAIICIATDYHNYFITRDQTVSQRKWKMVNKFMKSHPFEKISDQSVIYAPSLYRQRGIVANHNGYWSHYIDAKTGKKVSVVRDADQLKNYPAKDRYFIKLFRENPYDNRFLIFSKLDRSAAVDDPISTEVILYHFDDKPFIVYGMTRGFNGTVRMPNTILQTKKRTFSAHVDPHRKKDGTPEIAIKSAVGIKINTFVIRRFSETDRSHDVVVNYSNGWSYMENNPQWVHRWSVSKTAVIHIYNRKPLSCIIHFKLATLKKRNVTIHVNLQVKKEMVLQPGVTGDFTQEVFLEPDVNSITISTDENLTKGDSPDPRKLSFAIFNFSIGHKQNSLYIQQ